MRKTRVKILRRQLNAIMPKLREAYGNNLKPYKQLFKQVKRKYNQGYIAGDLGWLRKEEGC